MQAPDPDQPPNQPPALRRDLGTLESYAALVGILVGAGIYRVIQSAYAVTGPSVVLGYVVLAPVILATAIPYAAFQSTSLGLGPGGDYAHIRAVFGSGRVSFLAAWLKLISYLGALVYLAMALGGYLAELLPLGDNTVATLCLVGFWAIHCAGVRWFGRIQVVMCVALVASILVLVGPGLFAMSSQNYRPFFTGGAGGFLLSLPPLFFAFAGFEALAHAAGEVRHSRKRLPRVYLRGVLWTTAIFLCMSAVSVGVLTAAEMSATKAPMAAAAAKFLPVGLAWVVTVGAILALATSVNATMAVPARLAITVAQDRRLPKGLARIHPRTGTPVFGLTLSLVIALAVLWSGQDFALGIAVLALMVVYFLHSLAFVLLPRHNPDLAAEVAVRLPVAVQRLAAWAALGALGILIVTLVAVDLGKIFGEKSFLDRCHHKELTALELFMAWALLGWILHNKHGPTP